MGSSCNKEAKQLNDQQRIQDDRDRVEREKEAEKQQAEEAERQRVLDAERQQAEEAKEAERRQQAEEAERQRAYMPLSDQLDELYLKAKDLEAARAATWEEHWRQIEPLLTLRICHTERTSGARDVQALR